MKTKAYTLRLSELSYAQRCHFAWRLEHNGCFGMGTAGHAARGDWGDLTLLEIGKQAFKNEQAAKIQAHRVAQFKPTDEHLNLIKTSPFTAGNLAIEIRNGIA